jgi:hypothetical protein
MGYEHGAFLFGAAAKPLTTDTKDTSWRDRFEPKSDIGSPRGVREIGVASSQSCQRDVPTLREIKGSERAGGRRAIRK